MTLKHPLSFEKKSFFKGNKNNKILINCENIPINFRFKPKKKDIPQNHLKDICPILNPPPSPIYFI